MSFDNFIDKLMKEDSSKVPTKEKPKEATVEGVARKHLTTVDKIRHQLNIGTIVEMEHTEDESVATKIAMEHIDEVADYYDKLDSVDEMTSGGVVGGSPTGSGGIAPQDNIEYAEGDARVPKLLFKDKKKKKKIQIQRRPKIGM